MFERIVGTWNDSSADVTTRLPMTLDKDSVGDWNRVKGRCINKFLALQQLEPGRRHNCSYTTGLDNLRQASSVKSNANQLA